MRLVVVVSVLICMSSLVSVGSTSIGISRKNKDFNNTLNMADSLDTATIAGISRKDQYFNYTLDMADSPDIATISGISRKDQDFNDTLDMADSPAHRLADYKSPYKKYRGFIVGCYQGFCFRRKWKDSTRWGWLEDWEDRDYKPGGKERKYVPCSPENHQYCLDYIKQRPGDFPCYASKWSEFPCYKGRRFGCVRASVKKFTVWGTETDACEWPGSCCWVETLMAPYHWDWVRVGTTGKLLACSKYYGQGPPGPSNACSEAAHNEIDSLFEL